MFYKLDERATVPRKSNDGDAGFDVAAVSISNGNAPHRNIVYARTGLAVIPPGGTYFELFARSSLHQRGWALANGVGVIDATYRGEIVIPLVRLWPEASVDNLAGRLAQLVPRRLVSIEPREITKKAFDSHCGGERSTRKTYGFGSSGV